MTRAFDDDERLLGDLPTRSATAAAREIDADDTMLVSGFGSVGNPKAIPEALAASDRNLALTVVSGGSTGDQIDTDMVEADAIARRIPYQARPEARRAVNDRRIAFHDTHISRLGDQAALGEFGNPDVAVVEAVAVGEDWLVPSTSIGHTPAYVEAANRLVVEVNWAQPTALAALHDVYRPGLPPRGPIPLDEPGDRIGDSVVEFDPSKLVAVVETDDPDTPYSFRDPTDADEAIATNLVDFLTAELDHNPMFDEAVRLQFGVGSMGNALMGALESFDVEPRRLDYFGEVFQDGLLDLVQDGTFNVASATSLALSEDGQKRLFDDIEGYAERLVLRPADVLNRAELIDRFGVVAVNSALEVDIYGNANSTHVGGTRLVNGLGGSGDFNRNSLLSVTALPSTAGSGSISRVVPAVPHVDHPEHDVSVVVTEHGVADLRGLSPIERAETLIEDCADPDFRPRLREYVDRAGQQPGHIPHDLDVAFGWFDE